jgi:hypothetical protein
MYRVDAGKIMVGIADSAVAEVSKASRSGRMIYG